MTEAIELGLPAQAFDRQDDGDDLAFYAAPAPGHPHRRGGGRPATSLRLHRDADPRPAGVVLDLMSSWVSQPPARGGRRREVDRPRHEPARNSPPTRLDRWFVRFFVMPDLSEGDARYDTVLICVGVQYLQHWQYCARFVVCQAGAASS
ncbi:MAG: hypothetical protein WKG07_20810 [Hymenobacter sp.]